MSREFKFGTVPKVKYRRSKFDLSFNKRFSMSTGSLYPMYIQEIYPGDTFKVKANSVLRVSSAFLKPVMDNLFLDTYYFFVPHRLVNEDWQKVMGENTETAWAPEQSTDVAMLPSGTVTSKTVADYLGLPVGQIYGGISPLPFRAFALIYNEWFRDQNNIDPVMINTTNTIGSSEFYNDNSWSPNNYFGRLPKVAKMHDYFTTCLPNTQKANEPVSLDLNGFAPVLSKHNDGTLDNFYKFNLTSSPTFINGNQLPLAASGGSVFASPDALSNGRDLGVNFSNISSNASNIQIGSLGFTTSYSTDVIGSTGYDSASLVADLNGLSTGISVNDLRLAVAIQRMLEKDARTGTRYKEVIEGHFGVVSPDARLQRPEYLGGNRMPINVQQVPQTSQPTTESPLGSLGAYSLSNGQSRYTKSFVEHGFVIGVCCLRQFHTYQQGIEKFWTRSKRYDFYDPLFAHLGEQAVYKSELYGLTDDANADIKGEVFGYNEAWADLRYRPSQTAGEMRSDATNSFDVWHFGDDYTNAPTLNEQFINETPVYVDRTLAVPSTSVDQFLIDIYFDQKAYRVLPTYSIPGYVDHDFT